MGSGPHSPLNWSPPEPPSPQWSDNVARMHKFMAEYPDVVITTPLKNGTGEFMAAGPGWVLSDASLGWLMDKLEQRHRGALPG